MTGFGGIGWGLGSWGSTEVLNPTQEVTLEDTLFVSDEVNHSLGFNVFLEDTLAVSDEVDYSIGFKVSGATALSFFTLEVRFSSPLDASFLPFSDPANYTIPGLTVTGVLLGDDRVTLSTTPAQSNLLYTVTVAQGRNDKGDPLGSDNTADFVGYALIPTFLAGAISATQVDLVFSTEMNPNAAFLDPSNYTIRGGPGGSTIPVTSVVISGGVPIRRVSLRLAAPLEAMESYAAIVSSAVTSILGQVVLPDTYLFKWADMSRPAHGVPLEIPIQNFSGEVQGGLLGNPAGQVFFSPAYEAVGATSTIELESVSVCTRAFDQYEFPALLDPPSLYTFGPGVSSVLGAGFILWAPAEKLGLFKSRLSNFGQEDVLPKIYDSSTGSLESPIGDSPAIATLREPIDITRASFLNDLRWRTFPGTDAIVFTTADNMTPIGPGPITVRMLSPMMEARDPNDFIDFIDSVDAKILEDVDNLVVTDTVDVDILSSFGVLVYDTLVLADQTTLSLSKSLLIYDSALVTDSSLPALTYARLGSDAVVLSDQVDILSSFGVFASDTLVLTDQASLSLSKSLLTSDNVIVTDISLPAFTYARLGSDVVDLSDQVDVLIDRMTLVSDSIYVTDSVLISGIQSILVTDAIGLSDQGIGSRERSLIVSDTVDVLDGITAEAGSPAATLYSEAQAIFGAKLRIFLVGEDIVENESNQVTAWPDRTNVDTLTNSHATNRFTTRIVNGRRWLYTSEQTGKSLESTEGRGPVYMVMASMPPLPFTDYKLALGSQMYQAIAGHMGNSALYSPQSINRYVDGVNTDLVTSGIHLLEATVSGTTAFFFIGGLDSSYYGYPNRDWTADIGCVLGLASDPTAQERADILALLRAYYGVVV